MKPDRNAKETRNNTFKRCKFPENSYMKLKSYFFVLFFPVCILNESLNTVGETERNPNELLPETPT